MATLDADLERLFALEASSEAWLDRVREAESPASLGSIGPYTVVAEVARGGQGVVYRAVQPGLGRQIAIKRMRSGALASQSERRRFEREIEAASALSHPNIVTAYAADVIDAQPVLAMEWVEGASFSEWARGTGRSVREIVETILGACEAVSHAHRRGVIHRDLKPSNILVDGEGRARVLDFGLAQIGMEEGASRMTQGFAGTPMYAAPEQAAGRWTDVDVRTDVYALGTVLYEAIAGRPPFDEGGSLASLLRDVETREPAPLVRLRREVGQDLSAVVGCAMAKLPEARYVTVDLFAEDLRAACAGRAVAARLPSRWYRARKWISRHRAASAIVTLALAAPSAVAVTVSIMAARLDAQRREAITAREEERTARLSAERSSEFIEGLFLSPHPTWGYGPETRLRDVLDAASQHLLQGLDEEPQVALRLHRAFGIAWHGLGALPRSEEHFRMVLKLATALGDAEQIAFAQRAIGMAILDQGRPGEALPYFERASEWYAAHRAETVLPGVSMIDLGRTRHLLGESSAALELLEQAEAHCERFMGSDGYDVNLARRARAIVLLDLGRAGEAEALARVALESLRRQLGESSVSTANSLIVLGETLEAQSKMLDAERCFQRAVDIYFATFGTSDHPDLARALTMLGAVQAAVGKPEAGVDAARRGVDMLARIGGQEGLMPDARERLAEALDRAGRHEEAAELRSRAGGGVP